ncbi:unnamed protein product [Toxocara canis]|uniref:AdoMet activation domain-containing protein n=1 Tax=Toxocara canis TaxID=6265 RepID=A0A183UD79_TOXCA|nr:unnamed protein product [Toxocara canis]
MEHYESLKERRFVTLEAARSRALKLDFTRFSPVRPTFLGREAFRDFDLNVVVPFIDWKPFFDVWQLRGKYPNRGYPRIFNDADVGAEARKVFDDAQATLQRLIDKGQLKAAAVIGFFECCANGDDIFIFDHETRLHTSTLFGLRQQCDREYDQPCLCLSDFVAPGDSSHPTDYIGAFACTAGIGSKEICTALERDHLDDYSSIMVKALADRLSEAMAEYLHMQVRRKLWGYSTDEELDTADLLSIKYTGIRPAPGYPIQPDHTEKATLWRLLDAENLAGIKLTESYAMEPAASVCGLYFAHPQSQYFAVGKIDKDQVQDYALRKEESIQSIEYWLGPMLGYDHE